MDSIYIKKVLEGDTQSFQFLVGKYKEEGFSVAFSIVKNQYQAEEILQESFIKAFEKLDQFKGKSSFKTWFFRIIINESLQKTRKSLPEQPLDFALEKEQEVNSILDDINLEEQRNIITDVFETLTPNESLALDLYHLKEYSIKEIEDVTDWKASKIKMLLSRGRKNFYGKLLSVFKIDKKSIL
ncbi:RNA polymerase sigma factor [Flammeovirga sp. MY04]|uniref:RNA polymerase sigma factor n=1 Tax=Flammeovirga sp. MY04 TaxID=1191459 RepID=UPI0008064198|nr:RNA polymerase sigma factor [Flammeovirga sp. MY04]ANQ49093.1 RNA polymerase sigma factor [Flammeovirga sp. MY04]